ncbi:MAG: DUF86 domain-containing protein [Steroidobacteraceae bacterium]
MKSKHPGRIPEYLQHILDAINRALEYVAAMNFESFKRDTRTQDAVIRSIQIIGEAANKVRTADPEFAAQHPHVPWAVMYGMRNRVIHDYFEVDLAVVWQTVQQDLPELRSQMIALPNVIKRDS